MGDNFSFRDFNFDDLFVGILLALLDEDVVGLPKDITLEQLATRFPEIYERIRLSLMAQQSAAAKPCAPDDAIQTPAFERKRR